MAADPNLRKPDWFSSATSDGFTSWIARFEARLTALETLLQELMDGQHTVNMERPRGGRGFNLNPNNSKFSGQCYSCGERGHMSRNCRQRPTQHAINFANLECYRCHQKGHISDNCTMKRPQWNSGNQDPKETECLSCGHSGHNATTCYTDITKKCNKCSTMGHLAEECRSTIIQH